MSDPVQEARTVGAVFTGVLALFAVVLAAGALIVATAERGGASPPVATSAVDAVPDRVEVTLSEFAITPDLIQVATGGTLVISNTGAIDHDLAVVGAELATPMLRAGESVELDLAPLGTGTFEVICTVPGHETSGMSATLSVIGAHADTAAATAGADAAAHGAETDWEALDAAMTETILSFPAATEGLGNQPLEPEEVREDGTKVFRLTASTFDWELEPDVVVEGWGYNEQIPGPLLQLDLGDTVEVIVENQLPMGTDVHWHGVRVPNDQDGVAPITQDLIAAGETFTYRFTADEPAIGMYHPHHHGQMKLPNGMFGVMIVGEVGTDIPFPSGVIGGREVPEDLDIVAEIPMVLNDAGTIGLSLNGKSFPATEPIVVDEGDWFVIHYYNEGLQIHPMHLHQMPQLVFAKDGFPLDAPRWEDTVNVAPGERFSVLVRASDPGVWVLHCHILTHAERAEGMFGMVTAVIVNEAS